MISRLFRKRDPYAASEPRRFGWIVIAGGLAGAFVLGIGVGWVTTFLPGVLFAPAAPSVAPTVSSSGTSFASPVAPSLYPAINRALESTDTQAGLSGLDIAINGSGVFEIVDTTDEPAETGVTRWVRVEVESGQPVVGSVISDYAIGILNDAQGWGSAGTGTGAFARTAGAADFRLIFASPGTIANLCPARHLPRDLEIAPPEGPIDLGELASLLATPSLAASLQPESAAAPEPTGTLSPSPSASGDGSVACIQRGIVMIDLYQWAAGLEPFGETITDDDGNETLVIDTVASRAYLLQHMLGHYLGEPDRTCDRRDAHVMVDVLDAEALGKCTPTSWPFPVDDDS